MSSSDLSRMTSMDALREPVLRAAIRALDLPPGTRGLDAGCGLGLPCLLLAEAVGEDGHVDGVDLNPEFVARGRERVEAVGLAGRVTLTQGRIESLSFEDDAFDWASSADCVGYAPVDPAPMLAELLRVVRPGGKLALLAWSSERLLPGYPGLEAALQGTAAGLAPFGKGMPPSRHFLRSLGLLRDLGLENVHATTLAGTAQAPLSAEVHTALVDLFEMRWPGARAELSADDQGLFDSLCVPTSPECVLRLPDYYALFTYTLFQGDLPA